MASLDSYRILAVRDGRTGPVTCLACGCRLNAVDGEWFHFGALAGRDARGCLVVCAEQPHDSSGRAVTLDEIAF
jgi:hypothetical protein